jgi:hypothetical protein
MAHQPHRTDMNSGTRSLAIGVLTCVLSAGSWAQQSVPELEAKAQDISDQIEQLQSDAENHDNAAEGMRNVAENVSGSGNCSGIGAMLCQGIGQLGAMKAQSNADKETAAADKDRAEIKRLERELRRINDQIQSAPPEPPPALASQPLVPIVAAASVPPPEPRPPTIPLEVAQAPVASSATTTPIETMTLSQTAKFIDSSLNQVGGLTYDLSSTDTRQATPLYKQFFTSISNVQTLIYKKPKVGVQCLMSYHDTETDNRTGIEDRDFGVLFNDIENLTLRSLKLIYQDIYPSRRIFVTPTIYRLDLHATDGGVNFLFFADEVTATTVAIAISHVVELCNVPDVHK